MKIAFYLNVISPHQLPLAREVVKRIGGENFRYVYAEDFLADRKAMGWNDADIPQWCVKGYESSPELMEADLVYTGIRCPGLIARRSAAGKKTAYYSERWFKPIPVLGMLLPGWLRMLYPAYRKMARQMVELLDNPMVKYLPCGPWAAKDMQRIGVQKSQFLPWGYFVAPGMCQTGRTASGECLRVLWAGKISQLKRVDTIVKAVKYAGKGIELTIVGGGPDRAKIEKMAVGLPIHILPSQPIMRIREMMRGHDVYVFASNDMDGWGAVVNEALEEGMYVIGTRDTGASAAMLPDNALFSAGDYRGLARLLKHCMAQKKVGVLKGQGIGEWTASAAADRLLGLMR